MKAEELSFFTYYLADKKTEIKDEKPKPSHVKILNPSDQSDWKMIKYFDRVCRI